MREESEHRVRELAGRAAEVKQDAEVKHSAATAKVAEWEGRKAAAQQELEQCQRCAVCGRGVGDPGATQMSRSACAARQQGGRGALEGRRGGVCAWAVRRTCELELNALKVELRMALEAMLQHRVHIKQLLAGTLAVVGEEQRQLAALPVPC